MKTFFKALTFVLIGSFVISCNKDEETAETFVERAYADQIPGEITEIETFFDKYHMDVDADKNVEFTEITTGTSGNNLTSIKADFNPQFKTINYNGYDFKVYYIQHQDGTHLERRPCPVDSVLVSYDGLLLKKKTGTNYDTNKTFNQNQRFDRAQNPVWFTLDAVVAGWQKMVPFLFPGDHTYDNASGALTFTDYGAGVYFLPSGLGYYSNSQGSIPAYSTLIFNIKLMKVNFSDNDFDQIESRDEEFEIETDPVKFANNPWKNLNKDTDGDGRYDYLDIDDDNDGFWTKVELRRPAGLGGGFYPFNEIPGCDGLNTDPMRIKRHLTKCN